MIVRAFGNDATVELFDHHLVIKSGSRDQNELFVPLTSIKAVQFRRPGMFRSGQLILSIDGKGQSKREKDTTILFHKYHLQPFEEVLRVIRMAIATPSIEQLAMAAMERQRSSERFAAPRRPATPNQLERIDMPGSGGAHTIDAEYADVGGGHGRSGSAASASGAGAPDWGDLPPLNPTLASWWKEASFGAKAFVVVALIIVLLAMCTPRGEEAAPEAASAADDATSAATDAALQAADTATDQPAPGPSADQMLSSWSEFATGEAGTIGFALTDGDGHAGQFCNATTGTKMFKFGGMKLGDSNGIPIYDYLAWSDGDDGYAGAFWFDPGTSTLTARNLIKKNLTTEHTSGTRDVAFTVSRIEPGIVGIDGERFHVCVL